MVVCLHMSDVQKNDSPMVYHRPCLMSDKCTVVYLSDERAAFIIPPACDNMG